MAGHTEQVAKDPTSLAYFAPSRYSEFMHFTQLQNLLPQRLLCQFVGWLAKRSNPVIKGTLIRVFRFFYVVDMEEYVRTSNSDYLSFNDFFTRQIKSEARPITEDGLASPVDGTFSCLGRMDAGKLLQAKNRYYSLRELLAGSTEYQRYEQAAYATIYLAPTNYHRVHVPMDSVLEKLTYVPGKQFSVNKSSTTYIPNIYARNERLIAEFSSTEGRYCLIMVGALLVAGMSTVASGPIRRLDKVTELNIPREKSRFSKGDEFGAFQMGSTVILLFESGNLGWSNKAVEGQPIRFGQAIGRFQDKTLAE